VSPRALALDVGRSLRPVGEVGGFAFLFLVTSLLVAAPFALLTGHKVLGIWYILPFTVLFLVLYQRYRHRQGLRHLGLVRIRRWSLLVVAGFGGSGLLVVLFTSYQLGVGWMQVASVHPLLADPGTATAGVVLALSANLGLGFGEELLFRGYVFHRLLAGYRSRWTAVGLSSVFYSAVHIPEGRQLLSLLNLFLLGTLLALAVLLTRTLWLAIGLHAGWNFWLDGVCIYDPAALARSRMLEFRYHLAGQGELTLFKLTISVVLLLAILALAVSARRRGAVTPEGTSP
jgi:membrane protease YdiL (CAAX protease family)